VGVTGCDDDDDDNDDDDDHPPAPRTGDQRKKHGAKDVAVVWPALGRQGDELLVAQRRPKADGASAAVLVAPITPGQVGGGGQKLQQQRDAGLAVHKGQHLFRVVVRQLCGQPADPLREITDPACHHGGWCSLIN
jgi:hypothetical protein